MPNACVHEWEHPICIQKDVQIKQYAVQKGVLMGASKRNCSISNTQKRSQDRNTLRRVFDDEGFLFNYLQRNNTHNNDNLLPPACQRHRWKMVLNLNVQVHRFL